MKYTQLFPCSECPFRKKSLAGWLGPDSNPQELINRIMGRTEIAPGQYIGGEPQDFACHCDTSRLIADQDDGDPEGELSGDNAGRVQHCVGALLFLKAICKLPHDRAKVAGMDAAKAKEPMIETEAEFVRHHKGTPSPAALKVEAAYNARTDRPAPVQHKPRLNTLFGKAERAAKRRR